MPAFLLSLFRFIHLLGSGHQAVVLENLALRQQLAIYKRKQSRPRLMPRDRWFWTVLARLWKRSGLPRVDYGHTCGLKVTHIPGHDRHAVNKRCGRDESVTIRASIGYVECGASLGNRSINREDATVERGQNVPIHPGSKDRALVPVSPFCEKNSYLQFQY